MEEEIHIGSVSRLWGVLSGNSGGPGYQSWGLEGEADSRWVHSLSPADSTLRVEAEQKQGQRGELLRELGSIPGSRSENVRKHIIL